MYSGSILARLVSISSHRQQSKWYMRVIICVTIMSREVFFFLRLRSLVSLISELRDCLLSKTKPEKRAEILRRYQWFPREISCEERAEKFHTDDATLPRFPSDWLKQFCHTARPMKSTTQIRVSALVPQTSFRKTKPVIASRNVDFFLGLSQKLR